MIGEAGRADLRRAKPRVAEEIFQREEASRRHRSYSKNKNEEAAVRKHAAEVPPSDWPHSVREWKAYVDHASKDLRGHKRTQKALRDIEREKAARLRRDRVTKGRGKPKFKGKL